MKTPKIKYNTIKFSELFKKNGNPLKNVSFADIDDDTIISAFDNKETLLKWLIALTKSVKEYDTKVNEKFTEMQENINSLNTEMQENINSLNTEIGNLNDDINNLNDDVENLIPPIGSILHITNNNFNPNNKWDGTQWQLLNEGCFLRSVASNSIELATYRDEELPNVKGQFTIIGNGNSRGYYSTEGAFTTLSHSSGSAFASSGSAKNPRGVSYELCNGQLDSNNNYIPKADSVYKNGGKVLPYNYGVLMWVRVA